MKKKIVIFVVIFVLGVSLSYLFCNYVIFTEDTCLKNYLKAYINQDFKSIQKLTNIKESEFVTAETYFNNDMDPLGGIKDYKITETKKIDNSTYHVIGNYEYKQNYAYKKDIKYSLEDKTIVIKKSKSKKYHLFNNWTIAKKANIQKLYVNVPEDTKIYLDNIEVSSKYIRDKDYLSYEDEYEMPELLNKKYEIKFVYPFGDTQIVNWKPTSLNEHYVTFELNDNLKTKLLDVSQQLVTKIYRSMNQLISYEEFVKSLNYNEFEKNLLNSGYQVGIKDTYEYFYNQQSRGENLIKKSDCSNFEINKVYMTPEGLIQVNLSYDLYNQYANGNEITSKNNIKIMYAYDENNFKYMQILDLQFH